MNSEEVRKFMKRKIFNIITDIVLIAAAFALTDYVMLCVIGSENIWLELGVYIVFYAAVFGIKSGVLYLYHRMKDRK